MNLSAADSDQPRRVCVVMLSALGDTVHALPVVTALKAHDPAVHVTWILQPGPALLVRGHAAVDEILVFHRSRGWRGFRDLRRELRARRFDVVLALQPYFKAGLITWMARAPVKLGFDIARSRDLNWLFTTRRIPRRAQRHLQDQFFEFLDALGVPHGAPDWGLTPGDAEREVARRLLGEARRPVVGFVVATSRREKNWKPERYAELASRLGRDLGASCVLLGAATPHERAAADAILAAADPRPIDALGSGLRNLLGLLEACDVVVSPDTGPFHMCVAMNVPAVGLYGFTNPKRVGPYQRFGDLLIDAYGNPGEDYPASGAYRPGRMARITTEQVFEKVQVALRKYARGAGDWDLSQGARRTPSPNR